MVWGSKIADVYHRGEKVLQGSYFINEWSLMLPYFLFALYYLYVQLVGGGGSIWRARLKAVNCVHVKFRFGTVLKGVSKIYAKAITLALILILHY